jgi:hypothetical protein
MKSIEPIDFISLCSYGFYGTNDNRLRMIPFGCPNAQTHSAVGWTGLIEKEECYIYYVRRKKNCSYCRRRYRS